MLPLTAFIVLLASASGESPSDDDRRVLLLDLSGDVDADIRRTVGGLVARDLARAGMEVISGEDLRQLSDLEAERQVAGCDPQGSRQDESCLADIAGAMNAGLVVTGFVGRLGTLIVVNLSLFDAHRARSHGRQTVEAESLDALPSKLSPAVSALVADFLRKSGNVEQSPSPAPYVIGGGGVGVLIGAAALIAGGVIAAQHGAARDALFDSSRAYEADPQNDSLLVTLANRHDDAVSAKDTYNTIGVPLLWAGVVVTALSAATVAVGAGLLVSE